MAQCQPRDKELLLIEVLFCLWLPEKHLILHTYWHATNFPPYRYLEKADSAGRTLLHHAVRTADLDMIRYLLEQGSNVNHVDSSNSSLLHHLAAGPRTNKQGSATVLLAKQICDVWNITDLIFSPADHTKCNFHLQMQKLIWEYERSYS